MIDGSLRPGGFRDVAMDKQEPSRQLVLSKARGRIACLSVTWPHRDSSLVDTRRVPMS